MCYPQIAARSSFLGLHCLSAKAENIITACYSLLQNDKGKTTSIPRSSQLFLMLETRLRGCIDYACNIAR